MIYPDRTERSLKAYNQTSGNCKSVFRPSNITWQVSAKIDENAVKLIVSMVLKDPKRVHSQCLDLKVINNKINATNSIRFTEALSTS